MWRDAEEDIQKILKITKKKTWVRALGGIIDWVSYPVPAYAAQVKQLVWVSVYQRVSTLYVELARTAPPTNTNFRLTFLLTRLQEALYEDLPV